VVWYYVRECVYVTRTLIFTHLCMYGNKASKLMYLYETITRVEKSKIPEKWHYVEIPEQFF